MCTILVTGPIGSGKSAVCACLKARGVPILPADDDRYYASGLRGRLMQFLYFVMAKNKTIGDLVACEHCRNAYEEMELLDKAFEQVIARTPDYPMPSWQSLKAQMPDWAVIRERYGGKPWLSIHATK